MKICAKVILFMVILLSVAVLSLILSLHIKLEDILINSKKDRIFNDVKKIESECRYLIDQHQKFSHYILSDPNLVELIKVAKFTKELDPLRDKLILQKKISEYDAIEFYDKKGKLIVTTEGVITEKRLCLPEKIEKGQVIQRIITEKNLLKIVFWGHVLQRDLSMGTVIFKKNIDSSYLRFFTGSSKKIIAVIENESDKFKVRASSDDMLNEFINLQDITLSDTFTYTSNDYIIGSQHGVLSISPFKIDPTNKNLLFLYFVDKKDIVQIRKQITIISLILGIIISFLGCISAVFFSRRITKTLKLLSDYSGYVANGDFSQRIDIRSGDEIEDVCKAFNKMSDNLSCAMQKEKQLAAAEAAAAVEKRKVKELETARGQLDSTLQSIGDGVITTDMEGRVAMMNSVAEELTGWSYAEGKGRFIKEVFTIINEKTRNPVENPVDMVFRDGKVVGLANGALLMARDGKELPISDSGAPIITSKGDIIGVVLVFRDVTKRRKAEKALVQARIEAEAANMAKSEFLANMSHEIRTPMNGVLGFADMLLDTSLDEDQADYANTIKRSGESLLSLINDVLDFSKIEAGQLDFEEIDFDAELLAYDVCELIRPKIESKPIEVLCRIGDNVPSLVKGDPLRFRQVLTNLMGNAAKFTESGEIELSLDVEEEGDERIKLHAKIRDTGIGIPEDKMAVIFEPFEQADGSITRKYGGTGLGLSICKKISELMSGKVWAESGSDSRLEDGCSETEQPSASNEQTVIGNQQLNGSTTQRLNQSPGNVFHFTAWLGKAEKKEAKRFIPVSLSNKRAFVVDDSRANLDILRYVLESVGIYAVALTNGEDVVPELKSAFENGNPFDVCICDIQMPDMSGYDVAKQIKNSKLSIQNTHILALSSLMERDAKKCEEAGFDGFLTKPIRRKKLYQMLEKILGEGVESNEQNLRGAEKRIATQYSIKEEAKHSVRILLAEDNPVNQKLAKMMLTKAGYQVEVANNGKETVEKYTKFPDDFDLIFMDIQMSEMDGIEATKEIRKWENDHSTTQSFKHLPIIALTANAMTGDREKYLEAGMDDYVAKPIKRAQIFDILEKWISI